MLVAVATIQPRAIHRENRGAIMAVATLGKSRTDAPNPLIHGNAAGMGHNLAIACCERPVINAV